MGGQGACGAVGVACIKGNWQVISRSSPLEIETVRYLELATSEFDQKQSLESGLQSGRLKSSINQAVAHPARGAPCLHPLSANPLARATSYPCA